MRYLGQGDLESQRADQWLPRPGWDEEVGAGWGVTVNRHRISWGRVTKMF